MWGRFCCYDTAVRDTAPIAGAPSPNGAQGLLPFFFFFFFFRFDHLSVMVPTIMVSPWIKNDTIVGRPDEQTGTSEYEQSSITTTIKKIFTLSSDFITSRFGNLIFNSFMCFSIACVDGCN
jgi:hypothetical protein